MTVIPEGCGIATMKWNVTGKSSPISTTIGYINGDNWSAGESAEWVRTALVTAGGLCVSDAMGTAFRFNGVECRQNDGGDITEGADIDPIQGTIGDGLTSMVLSSSCVIQKRTALVGSHYSGRMFFPFMVSGESSIDMFGIINSGTLAFLQTKATVFRDVANVGAFKLALLHNDATPPTPITALTVASKVGTQRRRIR